jgi:TonB family protein
VVHRDLKPTNILFDEAGRPYISDFGLARLLEGNERLTQSRTVVGTPYYMSPEQGSGQDVDRRCDIYSLGVVAYQMLTGTTPFRGRSAGVILKQHETESVPVPPRALVAAAQFEALKKALAKKPAERWSSAVEFVKALETGVRVQRSAWPTVVVRWAWVGAIPVALFLAVRAATLDFERDLPQPVPISTSTPPRNDAQPPDLRSVPPMLDAIPGPSQPPASRTGMPVPGNSIGSAASSPSAPAPAPSQSRTQPDVTDAAPADPTRSEAEVSVISPPAPTPVVESLADGVVTQPERIGTLNPTYPPLARAAKIEGDVLLEAVVSPDGRVTQVRVVRSPNSALDSAAIRAVEQSIYKPGLRNGVPDTFTVQVTVRFSLR